MATPPIDPIDPRRPLTADEQVAYHLSRHRTTGFRDPGLELFRSRMYTAGLFGNTFSEARREATITFQTELLITDNAPQGFIFQFGDPEHSVALAVDLDGSLAFVAGHQSAGDVRDGGAAIEVDVTNAAGRRVLVTACCVPGAGRVGLFLDGDMMFSESVDPTLVAGAWSDATDFGAFGVAVDESELALYFDPSTASSVVGVSIVRPLSVYEGLIPRHFSRQRVT